MIVWCVFCFSGFSVCRIDPVKEISMVSDYCTSLWFLWDNRKEIIVLTFYHKKIQFFGFVFFFIHGFFFLSWRCWFSLIWRYSFFPCLIRSFTKGLAGFGFFVIWQSLSISVKKVLTYRFACACLKSSACLISMKWTVWTFYDWFLTIQSRCGDQCYLWEDNKSILGWLKQC